MEEEMNLAKYLAQRLSDDGYDGLVNVNMECGCKINSIMPCGVAGPGCIPAYRKTCFALCGSECEAPHECLMANKPIPANHVPLERIKEEA